MGRLGAMSLVVTMAGIDHRHTNPGVLLLASLTVALSTLAAGDDGNRFASNPTSGISIFPSSILGILIVIGLWATFNKAGLRGWAAIIPFYNSYTLVRLSGRTGWWFLLFLIPIVNIVFAVFVANGVAKRFGKGLAYGFFLLFLLPFIGYLMLGFGGSRPYETRS